MAGEFINTLDSITRLVRGLLFVFWMGLWLVMTAIPYLAYRNVADWLTRSTHGSTVWICECNPVVDREMIRPPFPFISGDGTGAPVQKYYACVHSMQEVENWLISHDYKKSVIATENYTDIYNTHPTDKVFFTRRIEGTKAFSIVGFMVDYGDGDINLFPFSYPASKLLVGLSRFSDGPYYIPVPFNDLMEMPAPPLLWRSTDSFGSHTFGGRIKPNTDSIYEYDKDYGLLRYAHLVGGDNPD